MGICCLQSLWLAGWGSYPPSLQVTPYFLHAHAISLCKSKIQMLPCRAARSSKARLHLMCPGHPLIHDGEFCMTKLPCCRLVPVLHTPVPALPAAHDPRQVHNKHSQFVGRRMHHFVKEKQVRVQYKPGRTSRMTTSGPATPSAGFVRCSR